MKLDGDEKEPLESVEREEWKSAGGGSEKRNTLRSLGEGHVPHGSPNEHPTFGVKRYGNPELAI